MWLFIRPSKIKYYTNEPPYVKSRLPIVGHVIGLLQYRSYSYVDLLLVGQRDVLGLLTTGLSVLLAKRLALPINGLDCPGMPGGEAYIIDSPELVVSIKRYPSKISFWHVGALFTGKVAGLSPFTAKAVALNVNGKDGQPSYSR